MFIWSMGKRNGRGQRYGTFMGIVLFKMVIITAGCLNNNVYLELPLPSFLLIFFLLSVHIQSDVSRRMTKVAKWEWLDQCQWCRMSPSPPSPSQAWIGVQTKSVLVL